MFIIINFIDQIEDMCILVTYIIQSPQLQPFSAIDNRFSLRG